MNQTSMLIKKDDLDRYLAEITTEEEGIVSDLKTILPHLRNPTLRKSVEQRLSKGEQALLALKAGYVPVEGGYFTKTDTKSKWQASWVKATIKEMPPEVKETWEKAKALGVFDSFSVTTGSAGDPLLVGNKGGKHFLVASWLPLSTRRKSPSLGFRLRL